MSDEQPFTDCGPEPYTRAQKAVAVVGLIAGIFAGYIFVDVLVNGRASAWVNRRGRGLGSEAETYLRAAANDRPG